MGENMLCARMDQIERKIDMVITRQEIIMWAVGIAAKPNPEPTFGTSTTMDDCVEQKASDE